MSHVESELTGYHFGVLGDEERRRVEEHLIECPECVRACVEIKRAIESIFHVKVGDVRTMQLRGKTKRQGRWVGRRNDWKKAIVTLQPDQKIELFEQI